MVRTGVMVGWSGVGGQPHNISALGRHISVIFIFCSICAFYTHSFFSVICSLAACA